MDNTHCDLWSTLLPGHLGTGYRVISEPLVESSKPGADIFNVEPLTFHNLTKRAWNTESLCRPTNPEILSGICCASGFVEVSLLLVFSVMLAFSFIGTFHLCYGCTFFGHWAAVMEFWLWTPFLRSSVAGGATRAGRLRLRSICFFSRRRWRSFEGCVAVGR